MYEIQLQWMSYLHQFRNGYLDTFFLGLNFFDTIEFFVILIPIIYFIYGRKIGLQVLCIFLLSKILNLLLKDLFHSPRPYHLAPELMIIQLSDLGFPSGATQTVVLLSGISFQLWKAPWNWIVLFIYAPLVSFSRVYLGVHFPMDIVAGWIVGLLLLYIYKYIFPKIEQRLEKRIQNE